jgi:hypothetical protein
MKARPQLQAILGWSMRWSRSKLRLILTSRWSCGALWSSGNKSTDLRCPRIRDPSKVVCAIRPLSFSFQVTNVGTLQSKSGDRSVISYMDSSLTVKLCWPPSSRSHTWFFARPHVAATSIGQAHSTAPAAASCHRLASSCECSGCMHAGRSWPSKAPHSLAGSMLCRSVGRLHIFLHCYESAPCLTFISWFPQFSLLRISDLLALLGRDLGMPRRPYPTRRHFLSDID